MDKILEKIVIISFGLVIVFILFAVGGANINPALWPKEARVFFVMTSLFWCAAVVSIDYFVTGDKHGR